MPHKSPAQLTLVAMLAFLCASLPLNAQAGAQPSERHNWWGDIDGYLNQQALVTLEAVKQALKQYPPQLPEPIERRMALIMIDGVLHDADAPKRAPVQQFLHSRVEAALSDIEATRVKEGAQIWKLYNHGFVVRTPAVTIGFDLVRGYSAGAEGFALADDILRRLVRQCDALFMSHRHPDHIDEFVAQAFLDEGKPVVAPPQIWAGRPIHARLTHLDREAHTLQRLTVQDGKRELGVVVYPGHQGPETENNVTLVLTPGGMSFCQTGDQSNSEDFAWIDQVGARHRVDVLMPNCWTRDIVRLARGFDPELIITGHENELGHTIDHREPYWLTYSRLRRSTYPLLVMTWGESYHYRPKPR